MKTSRWFALGIVCALLSLGLAAHNRSAARSQAQIIVSQDADGADVTAKVADLQKFVHAHMGSSVSFVLSGSYERQQESAQAQSQPQTSGDVYQQAQAACASIKNAVQQAQCNQNYLNSHLQAATPSPVAAPSQAQFSYVFAAPVWTPDAAGIVLLVSILSLLVAAGRLVLKK